MGKINQEELRDLLNEGFTPAEIARKFGVNRSSVCRALAKGKLKTTAVFLGSPRRAEGIVNKALNVVDQLAMINSHACELLELLMRWNRGDKVALQVLESSVTKKKIRVGSRVQSVKEYKFTDPRKLVFTAMAEIREQLRLQVDILKTLYDVDQFKLFEKEIITVLGEINIEARDRFVTRLREQCLKRDTLRPLGLAIPIVGEKEAPEAPGGVKVGN